MSRVSFTGDTISTLFFGKKRADMRLTKKPSNKEKKRYVFFKVNSSNQLKYQDVRNAVLDSLLDLIGDLGLAEARAHLIKNLWDQKNQTCVIKCSHQAVDHVKLALALLHHIGDEQVVFQTIKVSGTIKGLKGYSAID